MLCVAWLNPGLGAALGVGGAGQQGGACACGGVAEARAATAAASGSHARCCCGLETQLVAGTEDPRGRLGSSRSRGASGVCASVLVLRPNGWPASPAGLDALSGGTGGVDEPLVCVLGCRAVSAGKPAAPEIRMTGCVGC